MLKYVSLFVLVSIFVSLKSFSVFAWTYCFTNSSWNRVCTVSPDKSWAVSNFEYSDNQWNAWNIYNWYNESEVLVSGNPDRTINNYNYNNSGWAFSIIVWESDSDDTNPVNISSASSSSSSNYDWVSSVSWWAFEDVSWPDLNCYWLPWCANNSKTDISNEKSSWNIGLSSISNLISQLIQFVAVFAVFALVVSGIMYLISLWDEEKAKRAKKWIIWALAWVILSITAWWIISMLNKITIW